MPTAGSRSARRRPGTRRGGARPDLRPPPRARAATALRDARGSLSPSRRYHRVLWTGCSRLVLVTLEVGPRRLAKERDRQVLEAGDDLLVGHPFGPLHHLGHPLRGARRVAFARMRERALE